MCIRDSVCPLLVRQATLGRRQGDGIGGRLIWVKPEVVYQLLGGLPGGQVKQLCGEVYGISIGPASETVIVGFVQHHTCLLYTSRFAAAAAAQKWENPQERKAVPYAII